jgi:phage terminase large subunit
VNLKLLLSDSFFPLLEVASRYLVLCGGRGSGKSEFAARKILYRCGREGRHRFLVVRKVRKTLNDSVIRVIREILAANDIVHSFNKSELSITFATSLGMAEILFIGLDDPEKTKSMKGITSAWVEEATELSRDDFLKLDLLLRDPGPGYKQIILSFNPQQVEAPWLKEMFFGADPNPDAFVHRSTIDDNPIAEVRASYTRILDGLRSQDEALWKIARLGEWAARSGQIYSWDVAPLPDLAFDDIWCGGDFGYSVDPTSLVKIYRRADEFWLEELIYRPGLTNQDLAALMHELGLAGLTHYFDSAEPKSIEELRRSGFHVLPAEKGPDSVRSGIDFLRSQKIHILPGSPNLYREHGGYCWRKDKMDRPLPEPVKFEDHLMDAVRYGIFSHCARSRARVWSATWGA